MKPVKETGKIEYQDIKVMTLSYADLISPSPVQITDGKFCTILLNFDHKTSSPSSNTNEKSMGVLFVLTRFRLFRLEKQFLDDSITGLDEEFFLTHDFI